MDGVKMRFGLRARKGWKSKMGEVFYKSKGIKVNIVATDLVDTKLIYYEILKVLAKHYNLEYLDVATCTTVRKAGRSGKHTRKVVFTEVQQLIEKTLGNPSLRELKERIMVDSAKQRRANIEMKKKQKLFRTYRDNTCLDCDNKISRYANRCHKCAGKNNAKRLKARGFTFGKKAGRPKKKKGIFGW